LTRGGESGNIRTVSGLPIIDRRSIRRQATKDEIVAAAWELAREKGLAGIALRELGERVGMKAQSLYSYFGSKLEIYDAMFLEGYEAFEAMTADPAFVDERASARENLRRGAHRFFDFCTSDPVRYQLLFQRTIPDFVPSEESWAVATRAYQGPAERMAEVGLGDQETLDVWTAMLTGLTDQQISNDPGGDRWKRLVDRTVDGFLIAFAPELGGLEPWSTHVERVQTTRRRPSKGASARSTGSSKVTTASTTSKATRKTHKPKQSGGTRVARA